MIEPEVLEKYKLKGIFASKGVSSFFLINIEATCFLLITSTVTFLVLTMLKLILTFRSSANPSKRKLGFIAKKLIKR